jgi:glutathione S-transferase
MAAPAFTLHGIALSGPTYKVALMLSLAGQRFSYRHVDLRAGAHKAPEFLARNRYGQVPVLEHDGLALCQSDAILEYLAETLGAFGGRDAAARQRIREWLFWEADRLSPGIYRTRAAARGFMKAEPAILAHYRQTGEQALRTLDEALADQPFLTGAALTLADIACWGGVAFAEEAGFTLADWPNLRAWAERLARLPGFQGPNDLLPMGDMG